MQSEIEKGKIVIKKILIGAAVLVGGLSVYAATRPNNSNVERTAKVDALVAIVFGQLEDFRVWPAWSPWEKRDPGMTKTYAGPPTGVGSSYAWRGNENVGEGKMTVVEAEAPIHIKYKVELVKPHASVATMTFDLEPHGPDVTNVTWSMTETGEGGYDLRRKLLPFATTNAELTGGEMDAGLAALKQLSEAKAKQQAEIDAKSRAVTDP